MLCNPVTLCKNQHQSFLEQNQNILVAPWCLNAVLVISLLPSSILNRTWAKLCEHFDIFFPPRRFLWWFILVLRADSEHEDKPTPHPLNHKLAGLALWQMFVGLPPSYGSCPQAQQPPFMPSTSPLFSTPPSFVHLHLLRHTRGPSVSYDLQCESAAHRPLIDLSLTDVVILCFWACPKCLSAPDTAGGVWGGAESQTDSWKIKQGVGEGVRKGRRDPHGWETTRKESCEKWDGDEEG